MSVDSAAKKKSPAPPAPEVSSFPVSVRFWADREVSIANHKKTLDRLPGVTAVALDDTAKTATVTYTGDWRGLGEIGASLNFQGAVIDPAYFAANVSARSPSASLLKLPDLLRQVRGVRRVQAAGGALEFWASVPDLDLEGLLGLGFRFSFVNWELLEFTLAARSGGEKVEELRSRLLETRGVLRVDLAGPTARILVVKGKLTAETLRKLAAPFEVDVAPLKK
jgi:hypothetical protein